MGGTRATSRRASGRACPEPVQHDLFQPDMDLQTAVLNPGESGSIVVNLPAGTYQFWCTVPGHRDAGMSGTLTVE